MDNGNFKYAIDKDFDHTIDEKGNTFIALRKIAWGDSENYKLDLRKYYTTEDGERMNKGVSFLTDEGPNELARVLIDTGYGNAMDIAESIKNNRPDIMELLASDLDKIKAESNTGDFYDPRELLAA